MYASSILLLHCIFSVQYVVLVCYSTYFVIVILVFLTLPSVFLVILFIVSLW